MAGGSTSTNQNYNPEMQFAPTSSNGGAINIGGSVGMGNAEFGGSSTASGPSTGFDLNLNMGGMGGSTKPAEPATMLLMNLVNEIDVANIQSQANFNGNGAGSNHVKVLNGQTGSVLNFSQL